jgi:hypothetical protein
MTLRAMPARALGSPKPDRSKEMSQNDTLVLQVGGWAWG